MLIHKCLANRRQSSRFFIQLLEGNVFGVPQESILQPLLLNVFLCDLYFIMNETDFASYADDKTSYGTVNTIDEVIQKLANDFVILFK